LNPSKPSDPRGARQDDVERSAQIEALVQATEQLLAEHGNDGFSTLRIASRAKVSIGTLLELFGGKDALVATAMERRRAKGRSAAHAAASPVPPVRAASAASPGASARRGVPAPPPASTLFRPPGTPRSPSATHPAAQAPAPQTTPPVRTPQVASAPQVSRAPQAPRAPQVAAAPQAPRAPQVPPPVQPARAPQVAATTQAPRAPQAAAAPQPARAPQAAAAPQPARAPQAAPAPQPARAPQAAAAPQAPRETLEDGITALLRPLVSTLTDLLPSMQHMSTAEKDAIFRMELKRLATSSQALLSRHHVPLAGHAAHVMTLSCDKVIKDAIRNAPESFSDGRLEQALLRLCVDFIQTG
jgi:AcrR family transcriptional regulator